MSSLLVISQISLTLESLKASVMFFKRGQSLLNLPLKSMKASCLIMIQTHVHVVFLIRTPVLLKPRVTRCLMRLIAPKWSNMILML
jgi:hypothetical protein